MKISEMLTDLSRYPWWRLGTGHEGHLSLTIAFNTVHKGKTVPLFATAIDKKDTKKFQPLYDECMKKIKEFEKVYKTKGLKSK